MSLRRILAEEGLSNSEDLVILVNSNKGADALWNMRQYYDWEPSAGSDSLRARNKNGDEEEISVVFNGETKSHWDKLKR